MYCVEMDGKDLAGFLTQQEWRAYARGELTALQDRPVVWDLPVQRLIEGALDIGAHETDHVRMILYYADWERGRRWWPSFLYWPGGVPNLDGISAPESLPGEYFKVRFGTFFCFKCGLRFSGYVFDRDLYAMGEAIPAERKGTYLGCPRCGYNLKGLPLFQILSVEKSD